MGVKIVTIKQALQHVADNPELNTDKLIDLKVHELVARNLFEIANNPQLSTRESLSSANHARELIFSRLIGRRHPGTHPSRGAEDREITFVDLTKPLKAVQK